MAANLLALPEFSFRHLHVWRRNSLVWRKLAVPSILGNLADPMLYMLGLGYGLGAMLSDVGGMSYIAFLAAGTVCSSTMMTASFEAMYSGFSRMHVQRTWDAIMNAPVTLDDVVLGEAVWAASKSLLSGTAVLVVAGLLGLAQFPMALWVIPIVFVTGLAFAGMGLIMTALSPSYFDGNWHHFAIAKNGATATKLYYDGADVSGAVTNQTVPAGSGDIRVGASHNGALAVEAFPGSIDEPMFFNTYLSAARIAEFAKGKDTSADGLCSFHYQMKYGAAAVRTPITTEP